MSVDQSATDTSALPLAGFTLKLEYEVCFSGSLCFLSLRAHTSHLSLARARFLPHACALSPKQVFFL